ncbi:hypothetical protein [Futiania mangrovi]|uniref:DUF4410 domain-containing protein n=1 Tax=Futiania mangrovi TaxID=2959716 RepID=A0A9J6PLY7_9PROT|nr:hypothetical protein [Futiania mangrovii]MCP1337058.1 hypothetical protein [Futiania mangrovii]
MPSTTGTRRATVLAAALLMSGCATNATVSDVRWSRVYSEDALQAMSAGGMATEVIGANAEDATRDIRLPAHAGGAKLVPVQPGTARDRLVLVFDPRGAGAARTACMGGAASGAPAGGLKVTAVLCDGTVARAYGTQTVAAVSGPGAPGYAEAMRELLGAILPPSAIRRFEQPKP